MPIRTLALLVSALLPLTVSGQQILLVPSTYPTIQSAINTAANGDIVVVLPGSYNETIMRCISGSS